ncbi:MAG: ABC transporter permease [Desulfurococcaceae archaeon]
MSKLRKVASALILERLFANTLQVLLAFALGFASSAILILVHGRDPIAVFYWLFYGGFIRGYAVYEALAFATPLLLTGVAFAVAARAGLFNIGVEGQAYLGAIGAIYAGALLVTQYSWLRPYALPLALFFSALMGSAWAVVPALLKSYLKVHEVVSSIMFNWIAYWLSMFLVSSGPLVDPNRPEKSLSVVEEARFRVIHSILTDAVYFSLLVVLLIYFILWNLKIGFEIRTVGANPDAAKYAGINIRKVQVLAFLISGALAGLAGGLIVVGRPPKWAIHGTLSDIMYVGFDGIAVSMIGFNHPLSIILSAFFIGGLWNGSRLLEPYTGLSSELSRAITGLIVIALAIPGLIRLIATPRKGESGA